MNQIWAVEERAEAKVLMEKWNRKLNTHVPENSQQSVDTSAATAAAADAGAVEIGCMTGISCVSGVKVRVYVRRTAKKYQPKDI